MLYKFNHIGDYYALKYKSNKSMSKNNVISRGGGRGDTKDSVYTLYVPCIPEQSPHTHPRQP